MSDTVTSTLRWFFNYQTQCWDRVLEFSDGTYYAWQWDKTEKTWSAGRYLNRSLGPDLLGGGSPDDFNYWYSEIDYVVEPGDPPTTRPVWKDQDVNKDNSVMGQIWKWGGSSWELLDIGDIDPSLKTYIIIHGLRNTYKETWISDIAGALQKLEGDTSQILCIDWGDKSLYENYVGDVRAAWIDDAAERALILLSQLLGTYESSYTPENLKNGTKVDLGGFTSNISTVGHSYGAHLSAYFSHYLQGTIDTIYGLDSAEEAFQTPDNPILLGPDSAQTVFFYKSSDLFGGGDKGLWGATEENLLGRFNFYLASTIWQLTASDGLSTTVDKEAHGYACKFFAQSAEYASSATGAQFNEEILRDIAASGVRWHGIVNGLTCMMDCVTLGYLNVVTQHWNYADYLSAIDRVLTEPFFTDPASSAVDMPKNIYAVAYLTSLAIEDVSINGDLASGACYGESERPPIVLESDKSFSVSFNVHNYADNISIDKNEVLEAQVAQKMTHEIWVSTGAVLNVADAGSAARLYSSLESVGDGALSSIEPLGVEAVNASVEIDRDTIEKLIYANAELRRMYESTGSVELYLHVRVGVDGRNPSQYISGEMQDLDNAYTQRIVVNRAGIDVAFVIDTTGSMGNEIASVREAIKRKIYDLAESAGDSSKMPTMMLITFKDDFAVQLVTNDMERMLGAVSGLYASGGGDTPEYSNHALNAAIDAVAKGGKIFLATDAPSHKGPNVSEMVRKAKQKSLSINVVVTGHLDSSGSAVVVAPSSVEASAASTLMSTALYTTTDGLTATEEDGSGDDTAETATSLVIGEAMTGKVSYIDDRYDWYKVNLKAEYTYSVSLESASAKSFLTLYASDGENELKVVSNGEKFTICPDQNATYYLRVRAFSCEETEYSLEVLQTAEPSGVGSSLESFSILATETGGVYLALDRPSSTSDRAKYEAAVYNLLTSMTDSAVISVGPDDAPRGVSLALQVDGSNTNWRQGETQVDFGTDEIVVNSVEVLSATKLVVNVTIDADCPLSTYGVTVRCGSEVAEGKSVLTIQDSAPSEKILSVTLTSTVSGGNFVATIYGYATHWNSDARISLGPDVNISSFEVVDETTIRVEGSIAQDAALGFRTVAVENNGSTLQLDKAFFVSAVAALTPEILMVTPNAVTVGKETVLTILGRNVDFTTSKVSLDLGNGIEVLSIEIVDAVTIKVTVQADENLSEGFRDVKVAVDDQQAILLNGLDVTIANDTVQRAIELPFASDHRAYRLDQVGAADPVDYFRIKPLESGSYRIGVESSELVHQLVLSVGTLSESGEYQSFRSIVVNASSAIEEISGLGLEGGQDYYIAVHASETEEANAQTQYTLRVDPYGDKIISDDNTVDAARLLSWNEDAVASDSGWVGYGDAVDFYRFELEQEADVQLSVSDLDAAVRVAVYKENSAGGLTRLCSNSVRDSVLERTLSLTSGTYFVEIASYDGGAGRYNSGYMLDMHKEDDLHTKQAVLAQV